MRIRHSDEMDYSVVSGHRTGDITFKRMMQGEPDALDNFELSLVRNRGAYYTPRHRHNFDQIRLVLEGEFSYADKKVMEAGDAGFFPEGTYYGPQNVTDCITLVLQCGAPSSSGYLDYTTLGEGHRELARLGSFDSGVFTRGPGANLPGSRRKQDGYEAIWEYKRGQEITYPPARYGEPVIMRVDSFEWEPTAVDGVERRLLGTFINETRMVIYRLAPGACLDLDASEACQLVFVLSGEGRSAAGEWRRWDALAADRGERGEMIASAPAEVFVMGLPRIAGVDTGRTRRVA